MINCIICGQSFENNKKYKVETCSKKCAGLFRNKDALKLYEWFKIIDMNTIQKLADDYCTSAMIFDLLKRDYKLPNEFSLKQVRSFLNKKIKFQNNIECQKQPQWFKLQYKYPKEFSIENIKKEIINKCLLGQEKCVEIRKTKSNFGLNFRRENSPLCYEFYIKRGFTEEFAKEKVLEICLLGALSSCKTYWSSVETKVKKILDQKNILNSKQFVINLLNEEKVYNKSKYIYDIYLPNKKILIECNGLYWHASPEIYKSGDLIKLPRFGEVLVDKIWKIDLHKRQVAENRGYKVVTVWEGKETEIENII